jgi:hypothetical protein
MDFNGTFDSTLLLTQKGPACEETRGGDPSFLHWIPPTKIILPHLLTLTNQSRSPRQS